MQVVSFKIYRANSAAILTLLPPHFLIPQQLPSSLMPPDYTATAFPPYHFLEREVDLEKTNAKAREQEIDKMK